MSEFTKQVGGGHYLDMAVQPVQLAYAVFGGDALAYNTIKYLTRKKETWGTQGSKASHTFAQLCELKDSSHIPATFTFAQMQIIRVFIQDQPMEVQGAMATVVSCLQHIPHVGEDTVLHLQRMMGDAIHDIVTYYTTTE